MAISIGDHIPGVTLAWMTDDGPSSIDTLDLFSGKKVVLFAVPGAFTPTCSARHLPGFIDLLEDFKAAGTDTVACVSVNDVYVMDAWGKSAGADGILMLADGNAEFARALGLDTDATAFGMGVRSQRFALVADALEGVVCRAARMIRRARWLCLLSESTLCWKREGAGGETWRQVIISGAQVVSATACAEPGVPPGWTRSIRQRQQRLDRSAYDRLRILTTELRRLLTQERHPRICLRPGCVLGPHQLARGLVWI